MEPQSLPVRQADDDSPPLLRRWSRVYALVLCYLFLLISGLYVVTRLFRY